jgi:hypothetical protein
MNKKNTLEFKDLTLSKDYESISAKVASWKEELGKAQGTGIQKILDEKNLFFSRLREKKPELYAVFKAQDLDLSELAYFRLTGQRIVLD